MDMIQSFKTRDGSVALTALETAAPAKPSRARSVRAPGAGKFQVESVALSDETISAGDSVSLSVNIEGKGIAYLFTDLLMGDPDLDQYYGPVLRDFVMANHTRTIGGVTRPRWDAALELTLELRPRLRLLTDGTDSTFGFFLPASYDGSDLQIEGVHTSATGTSRRARLTFGSDGATKKLVAFKEGGRVSAPAALTLKPGDQFAPYVQLIARAEDDGWQASICLASPLTFRGEAFRWVERPPLPGEYLAGILAQDLDGGLTRTYAPLTVK